MQTYNDPNLPLQTSQIVATDTEPLIYVEYRGPYKYAKIKAATTTGDITLYADDTDGATTEHNTYLPGETVTAGTHGALNVSETGYESWGEIVDLINLYNCDGWYAWLNGALRADLTEASDGALTALARNTAVSCWRKPIALLNDSSALLTDVTNGEYVCTLGLTNKTSVGNSNEGRQIELHSIFSNTTEGTKDGTLNRVKVYDVDDDAKTEQLVYVVADAASAANFFNGKSDWGDVPIVSGVGNRLVVRVTNDVALTAPTLKCQWRSVPVVPRGTATLNGISSQ